MKVSIILSMVASSSYAQDRKVPPRTPSQRFETLNRFINEWIDYNIDQDLNRPMRAYNMKAAFERIYDKQKYAYDRCGFFDPNVPNGGPKPHGKNHEQSWKDMIDARRRRRSDHIAHASSHRARRSSSDNLFDEFEAGLQSGNGVRNAERELARALAADQSQALRQIRVGFFKWIHRYLGECNNQANDDVHSNRLNEISSAMKSAFEELRDEFRRK
jgi:hypothetical protein